MDEKTPHSAPIEKCGVITFGRSTTACTIRTISGFGAALDLAADDKLPDEFALTLVPDGRPRRCAVVWRKAKRVAVAFY
ncbi:PilZ domain-containing protein [Bradyrhizobium sp. 182]|uniref:PilZ domain-containing protein n=1 Tax=unclassified Bradyrhizobium TaxID=2631580 RepID=UPI001FFB954D|nr:MULTISPECIES: PilZ domain-containing protein [unclassified Bradyrhizobium]MCK1422718.1 PilZ domain-containing protein [Bradyrhizobium sp. CW12]MCK1526260.1 PilZ domain-containing protein [Bradyrhizobium sp. 182]MCK1645993.1 PilZ domain-containing protein [Bradyrhizobium sp. 154]MCK1665275.1 PilZ domain-containing protein [Bradyrhizobium sp. 153]